MDMRNTKSIIPFIRIGFLCLLVFCLDFCSVQAQQLSNSRRANQRYESAMQALSLNQLQQATAYLKQALQADQNFAEAHQALGDIYRRNKQYTEAANHYQQVISIRPNLTPMTWFGLGESLLLTGQYQQALEALQEFNNRSPEA
ncbi:MAG TPA: tetratricopeptide repeat protein, partial [Sphingobacteriaceae bacterium]|nr:tetratricopeptide repeat protein [Sphingobacteriaceae bacterium]